jgi:hypothetical protein
MLCPPSGGTIRASSAHPSATPQPDFGTLAEISGARRLLASNTGAW